MHHPHIALDFTSLDHLQVSNGQYRYGIDLVNGLASLSVEARFSLLGSRTAPPREVEATIRQNDLWTYSQLSHGRYRGAYIVDHAKFGLAMWRMRVDLVHALHTFIPKLRPFKVAVTEHDLMFDLFDEYSGVRNTREYRWYRESVKRADRIIAISQTTAKDLQRLHGIEPGRIDVVYHGSTFGASVSHQAEPQARDEAADGPVLLSPYNLEPRKNIRSLLQAVALARREFPQLRLLLYGRAAYTPEREREFNTCVKENNLEACIQQLGFVDDESLQKLYATCTLFVFPSLYEGFGLPLLEAMANGACVVARSASAMAEIVQNAGVLVETKNVTAFADAIKKLLRDSAQRKAFAVAARARAREFSIQRMAAATFQSYCAALQIPVPNVLVESAGIRTAA